MKNQCELFEEKVEHYAKERLDGVHKETKGAKFFNVFSPVVTTLVSIGGGIGIAMGFATFGITSFVTAAVAASSLVVMKIDQNKHEKLDHNSKELKNNCPYSFLLSIIKEATKELSRIFEDQLFRLERVDVTKVALCAVNLMFKQLKVGDKFNRNTLLRNVLFGRIGRPQALKTKRNNKKWKVPDVFQKPGLRKEIPIKLPVETLTGTVKTLTDTGRFQYLKRPHNTYDPDCDPDTYGYRGQIFELVPGKSEKPSGQFAEENGCGQQSVLRNRHECTTCRSGEDTINDVTYFMESSIDERYTENCLESSRYQPYHCVLRCPCILETFSQDNSSHLSLQNYVREIYGIHEKSLVKPVFRSHSPRKICSLRNTILTGSDFSRVHLNECILEGCDFTGCTIMFGQFKAANLNGTRFIKSHLSYCNLAKANARSCEWTATRVYYCCVNDTYLRGCSNYLGGNDWEGTALENARIGPL